ncbi:glycoside hydrolase family 18 protein [Legionella jordanis]|uniref:chitinase n=1 Tax=Legionella jordanis TaxID=456 RepID=A0A0W0V922_9GAMM|nr:glycoside hydrolase family 18 protein [Legionella jordanis]KTD16374.1 glycosyl hydrolase family 18 [Legionella jordanis]RMX04416.1 glycoside hydrolase family 18 protein [Legionella jordanis]VEH12166.1 glycosyl hydrolase family 18 [Legionella jordanis]HAT8715099.1 glycosyl hydrolase [Legionella jordanis]
MKRYILLPVYCCLLSLTTTMQAASIIEITPSSSSPIAISATGSTYLTYNARNNTSKVLNGITIEPGYGITGNALQASLISNTCSILAAGASCSFIVSLQGTGQNSQSMLTPRICAFKGATCSVPVLGNRVLVVASRTLPSSKFPLPYAGTFYPIYNSGPGQWLPPNQPPIPPFNRVSAIFIAFAHAYAQQNGAILTYERGQPEEPARQSLLVKTARAANPNIKILISLGWNQDDWTAINKDYVNHANIFVPSVIQFIRANNLDGFDIDDESVGGTSGSIPQANFDGVIANLRNALNYASLQDGRPYYLTITPAGNNDEPGGIGDTQIDAVNAKNFDLINVQTYFNGGDWGIAFANQLLAIGYPKTQIAHGIDVQESNCDPDFPPYIGFAGLFNWNMTKDSTCSNYANTIIIANLVGYYGAFR